MRLVLVTAPKDAAAPLARALVEERLAACVNIVPGLRSIYRWQGKIEDDAEELLLIKTTAEQLPALTSRVKALHSYEVPEVIALEIRPGEGNPDYLAWLAASVGVD